MTAVEHGRGSVPLPSRRSFVLGAIALTGATATGLACVGEAGQAVPEADTDGLAAVGRAYLRAEGEDLHVMLAALPSLRDATTRRDVRAALPALTEEVRRAYERGDVVEVDGWLLSRPEVRAAAVTALLPP